MAITTTRQQPNYALEEMTMLTLFGFTAVAVMMLSYALDTRSKWFVLSFAAGCAATAAYSGLEGVWPITVVEGLWAVIALRRFSARNNASS